MQTPVLHTARIKQIQKLTDTVYEFTFTFLDTMPMEFQAGQYGTVIIDGATRRQYSFCSDPKQAGTVSMVIDTKPNGPGSKYFLLRKVGDAIQMLAPLGRFIVAPSERRKVMIATGTGIAPIRSMILENVKTTPMTLYWGLRHETDVYWDAEFTALAKQYPTFAYHLVLSQPTVSVAWQTGHVTDMLEKGLVSGDADYYLCGNTHMIAEVQSYLLAHKVPAEQIKTELF